MLVRRQDGCGLTEPEVHTNMKDKFEREEGNG